MSEKTTRELIEWYNSIWMGDEEHGQFIPDTSHVDYVEYMTGYTLAHGAWQASEAISAKRIEELEAQIKQLHTGDNFKALVDEDTDALMQTALEMDKTIKAKDKQIKVMRDALVSISEQTYDAWSNGALAKDIANQAIATTDKG